MTLYHVFVGVFRSYGKWSGASWCRWITIDWGGSGGLEGREGEKITRQKEEEDYQ